MEGDSDDGVDLVDIIEDTADATDTTDIIEDVPVDTTDIEDGDADEEVETCPGGGPPNACEGCAELEADPGDLCGSDDDCGTGEWTCAGLDALICSSENPDVNDCGGCEELDRVPGSDCGECGIVVCDGADDTTCIGDDRNTLAHQLGP